MNHADNCDYIAFSDQDDYWLDDKLLTGTSLLEKAKGTVNLYFSAMTVVNSDLIRKGYKKFNNKLTFGSAFTRHNAAGCTMIFTKELAYRVNEIEIDEFNISHDSLVYIINLWSGGSVIYDEDSRILYRRHNSNVTGLRNNLFKRVKREISSVKYERSKRLYLSNLLINKLNDLANNENRIIVNRYLDYRRKKYNRFFLLVDKRFKFGNILVDIFIKALIITKLF